MQTAATLFNLPNYTAIPTPVAVATFFSQASTADCCCSLQQLRDMRAC
ncbi:hypothetical protein [Pontibacter akesuensis]|nr:hypothetical protein [Pontibacter akesuensis]